LPPLKSAGLLAALAVLALAHAAQGAERPARRGRFRLGPFHLTPRFELRNAGVDTNVFATRTDPIPDTAVVGRASLDGFLPVGKRLLFSGDGYLDLNYFRREESERSLDFGGEGLAELQAGRFRLFGGGGGLQAKQRFSVEVTERVLRQERWANAGLELELSGRISVRGTGAAHQYEFGSLLLDGEDIKTQLDRRSLSGTAELLYDLTRKTTAVVSAERIEDRFFAQIGQSRRTTLSYRYLAGVELSERAIVSGKVLAGIRQLAGSFGVQRDGYRAPALQVTAGTKLGRFGRLDLVGERDVLYSAEGVRVEDLRLRSAYIYTRYRGEATLGLPLELLGSGFAEWQEARFLLPQRQGEGFARVDHVYAFGGSLLRRFGDAVRIGGTVAWTQRLSNLETLAYRGLSYGVQAAIVP
jgi:hypothetical protein